MNDPEKVSNLHVCEKFTPSDKRGGLIATIGVCVLLLCLAISLDCILYYTSPVYRFKLHKLELINHTFPFNFTQHGMRHIIHFKK
jgi:hypothetical protein